MTDEEMIKGMRSMKLPVGVERNYNGWEYQIRAIDRRGEPIDVLCEYKYICGRFACTNYIGEHLKTLYDKCKTYNDMKIKEEADRKARGLERAIQLIKDL